MLLLALASNPSFQIYLPSPARLRLRCFAAARLATTALSATAGIFAISAKFGFGGNRLTYSSAARFCSVGAKPTPSQRLRKSFGGGTSQALRLIP
jgi:hypothetical protein